MANNQTFCDTITSFHDASVGSYIYIYIYIYICVCDVPCANPTFDDTLFLHAMISRCDACSSGSRKNKANLGGLIAATGLVTWLGL